MKLQVKSVLYNVKLSLRVNSIKYFRATSRVRWFKGAETDVSRIITVVIRQLTQGSSLMTRTDIILEVIKKSDPAGVARECFIEKKKCIGV